MKIKTKTKQLAILIILLMLSFGTLIYVNEDLKLLTNIFVDDEVKRPSPKVKPHMPDLLIERVSFDTDEFKIGKNFNVIVKVQNAGNVNADKIKVKIYDNNGWGGVQQTSVEAGLYKYVQIPLTILPKHKGVHNFEVIVDSSYDVEELNESNNFANFQLKVQ